MFNLNEYISSTVGIDEDEVILWPDVPYMIAQVSDSVELKCCFNISSKSKAMEVTWVKTFHANKTIGPTAIPNHRKENIPGGCAIITLATVKLNDSGLYQCQLSDKVFTHGTYLQVYSECVDVCVLAKAICSVYCVCV